MASSFPPPPPSNTNKHQEKVEEDQDWLKLGLGLGPSCTKPHGTSSLASSFSLKHKGELGLGLGLGLGFDEAGDRSVGVAVAASNINYGDLCEHYVHNNHDDMSSPRLDTLPSTSGPRLHGDRETPVPDASHDYFPPRSPSGLWFTLHSSINRQGEALPQIPKAYIRVKDENVTVFMVKKYLVTKLGLSNEAEIDISCMGQKLLHSQTLKEVRDVVWLPRFVETVNSTTSLSEKSHHDSSVNHLMSLHYGRPCL